MAYAQNPFATVVQMELETVTTEGLHLSGTLWYHIKTSASFPGLNAEREKAEVCISQCAI